ncbi:MAG: hypothetical protein BWY72_02346 [Bacteroidetes bacterium ADurb.Bin416]|nr:MAG: hypothetical protein BWY72_02346 [Bacteroidetes bacterium ADurb.Bin416]
MGRYRGTDGITRRHASFDPLRHDRGHQAVQVVFQPGITLCTHRCPIGCISGIETVGGFPLVRDAIPIRIHGYRACVEYRPGSPVFGCISRSVVFGTVDDAWRVGATRPGSLAVSYIVDHQAVHPVAGQGGTGIGQYLVISLRRRVGGGAQKGKGSRQSDGIFCRLCIQVIVVGIGYLSIDPFGPIVGRYVTVTVHMVAINIILAPHVQHGQESRR